MHQRLEPVPFHHVKITNGLWKNRIDAIRTITTRHCAKKCKETGRVDNFRKASGRMEGTFKGKFFDDADVYKTVEAIAYVLMDEWDDELKAIADTMIDEVCAAQTADGYLYTFFTLNGLHNRWTDMDHHEAFCVGQIVEAGIAYRQATGDRRLYDAGVRAIDQMMETLLSFKNGWINGHEGIEMALVHMYRYTGEEKYLKYAEWFIEQRGHVKLRLPISSDKKNFFTDEYCQNNVPVRELQKVVGHAVRAMYLYSGIADLASITGEKALVDALDRVWNHLITTSTYITGGIGQSSFNEGFTGDFSLPNLNAYCETCASIGMAFWNQRMNLINGDSKYADIVETEIFNGILSGLSWKGDHYFYENPLASVGTHHRREWFHVPCCPTNLVRFIPSIGGYIYAKTPDALYVNQFIPSHVDAGNGMSIRMETEYPWQNQIRIIVEDCNGVKNLHIRKPAWCETWSLSINDTPVSIDVLNGYLQLSVQKDDEIIFTPEMPVHRAYADPRVREDSGRVAVMRGPVIFCAEEIDNPGIPTEYFHADVSLSKDAPLIEHFDADLFGGAMTVHAGNLKLIPYYLWDNREAGGMAVWLREI